MGYSGNKFSFSGNSIFTLLAKLIVLDKPRESDNNKILSISNSWSLVSYVILSEIVFESLIRYR